MPALLASWPTAFGFCSIDLLLWRYSRFPRKTRNGGDCFSRFLQAGCPSCVQSTGPPVLRGMRILTPATEFDVCCGKTWNCPFLLYLYQIQGFSDSPLILPFIKQKNLVVVSYGSVLSPLLQSLKQDNLRAHCTLLLVIVMFLTL